MEDIAKRLRLKISSDPRAAYAQVSCAMLMEAALEIERLSAVDEAALGNELDLVEALEAVDARCRMLMIEAASDQSTVRAVGVALDKVRVRIRELMDQR